MLPLKNLAIKKALENNWQEASLLNKKILRENPKDIDALNRLAFSLMRLGKYKKARTFYKKVIAIDKTNPIALRNLKRVDALLKNKGKSEEISFSKSKYNIVKNSGRENDEEKTYFSIDELFIEEAGKTKTIELKNITDKKTISCLESGDCVLLVIKRSKIFIKYGDKYIGMLPDHICVRLIPFIKGGNRYQAFIKSADEKNVSIFVKEVKRATKFRNQPSFSSASFLYDVDSSN